MSSEPGLLRYLSASRLKCWQTCRRQFYYRYVERLVVPTAPALFIGRQIHEVLRLWNWGKWKNEPLSPEQLRAALVERWEADAQGVHPLEISGRRGHRPGSSLGHARNLLRPMPRRPDEQPEGVEVDRVQSGRWPPAALRIIDLVRPAADRRLQVGGPQSRDDLAAHQHATQLACYALLYRSATVKGKPASSCTTSSKPKCRR